MPEVKGVIEKLIEKKAGNGDPFTAIQLKGHDRNFFDWKDHHKQAGVKAGDTVKIEHNDGGQFQRISKIEKLEDVAETDPDENRTNLDRERRISRAIALKSACEAVKDGDLTCEPDYITSLAEKFEKWLMR